MPNNKPLQPPSKMQVEAARSWKHSTPLLN